MTEKKSPVERCINALMDAPEAERPSIAVGLLVVMTATLDPTDVIASFIASRNAFKASNEAEEEGEPEEAPEEE